MTSRRDLLIVLGAVTIAPRMASAQAPAKVRRIGMLSIFSSSVVAPWLRAFREGMRDLGWVEGINLSIEHRYAEGRSDRLPDLAAELVRLKVDVIVVAVSPDALAAQKSTQAIPIVLASASDPVALGLVESLARPGGNITGLSQMSVELAGKRLELLRDIVPKITRVAVLWNPKGAASQLSWKEIQLAARQLGVQLHSVEVRGPNDFDQAFEDATRARVGALFIIPDQLVSRNQRRIAGLALSNRLPSVFHVSDFVDAGGLVSYGPDRSDQFRRSATFVDKILKGAKPGDLPIEQPTKLELVINLKTARAIGLTIPQSVLARADRVIE